MIVTATAGSFGALPQIVSGFRTLGNETPVLNSWAGDGDVLGHEDPQVTNYYYVTYASSSVTTRTRPSTPSPRSWARPRSGSAASSTGAAAIDGLVTAINRAGGSTNGRRTPRTWRSSTRCRHCRASSASPPLKLVDVREPKEWAEGRIPGSIHIPLGELGRRSDELIREIPVVVVCRSGVRSLTGTDELLARGFADVASLNGGILAWARAGHPIES